MLWKIHMLWPYLALIQAAYIIIRPKNDKSQSYCLDVNLGIVLCDDESSTIMWKLDEFIGTGQNGSIFTTYRIRNGNNYMDIADGKLVLVPGNINLLELDKQDELKTLAGILNISDPMNNPTRGPYYNTNNPNDRSNYSNYNNGSYKYKSKKNIYYNSQNRNPYPIVSKLKDENEANSEEDEDKIKNLLFDNLKSLLNEKKSPKKKKTPDLKSKKNGSATIYLNSSSNKQSNFTSEDPDETNKKNPKDDAQIKEEPREDTLIDANRPPEEKKIESSLNKHASRSEEKDDSNDVDKKMTSLVDGLVSLIKKSNSSEKKSNFSNPFKKVFPKKKNPHYTKKSYHKNKHNVNSEGFAIQFFPIFKSKIDKATLIIIRGYCLSHDLRFERCRLIDYPRLDKKFHWDIFFTTNNTFLKKMTQYLLKQNTEDIKKKLDDRKDLSSCGIKPEIDPCVAKRMRKNHENQILSGSINQPTIDMRTPMPFNMIPPLMNPSRRTNANNIVSRPPFNACGQRSLNSFNLSMGINENDLCFDPSGNLRTVIQQTLGI